MNNRDIKKTETVENNSPENNSMRRYVRPFVQAGFASGIITTSVFPLQLRQVYKMTSSPANTKSVKFGPSAISNFLLSNYKVLGLAYQRNLSQSLTKSTIYTNKDYVQTRMDSNFSHENQSHESHATLEAQPQIPLKYRLTASVMTASVLTPIDLLFTQYFSTMKTRNQLCDNPYFPTLRDKMRFAKSGIGARACGIGSNAFFYILGQSVLNEEFKKAFPKEQYGYTSTVLSTLGTGLLGGASSHAFDVMFTNIIRNTKIEMTPNIPYAALKASYKAGNALPVTFKINAPSTWQIAKELVSKEGLIVFTKGGGYAIGITTVAYGAYHVAEKLANWMLPEEPQTIDRKPIPEKQNLTKTTVSAPSNDVRQAKQQFGLFQAKKLEAPEQTQEQSQAVPVNTHKPK